MSVAVAARPRTASLWSATVARGVVAVLAGLATGFAFQPYGWWPLLFLGVPALTLVVRGLPRRQAVALGYLYGLAALGVGVSWVHVLGVWVAVLLVLFESLWFALLGLALDLTSRLRGWPLAAACCWSLVEFGYSRVPFGGFGWSRIAYAVVDTPLAGFFPLVGVAGVSFLTALVGQLLAYGMLTAARHRVRRALVGGAAVIIAVVLVGAGLRTAQLRGADPDGDAVRVGIVQGNVPGRGIEALGRMRSVTNNHLSETVNLTARARLGQVPQPDFILWPENSTDIDPTRDSITRVTVQTAAEIAERPILVGAVMNGPGPDERQTAALWWDPDRGVLARYAKRNLVPFGEWIPFRRQLLPLVPILAEVGAQSVPGTAPGVLRVPAGGREIAVGDIICFELAYDDTVYDTITHGAQLLTVQSNNATYGGTGQIEQQFAITRARAMETRREIAVATTNSVSGFIDRDGRVIHRTEEFTAASLVVEMPLRTGVTPAVRLAPWLDRGLAAAGLLACLAALALRRPRTGGPLRSRPPTEDATP